MGPFASHATTRAAFTPLLKLARGQSVIVQLVSPSIDVPLHYKDGSFICGDVVRCELCRSGVGSRLNRFFLGMVAERLHLCSLTGRDDQSPFDDDAVVELSRNRQTNHVKCQRRLETNEAFSKYSWRDCLKAVVRLHKLPIIETMWAGTDDLLNAQLQQMALRAAALAAR